jgi:putative flippase GtrA
MLLDMDTTSTTTAKAPGVIGSFVRFVVFGGGVGLASSATLVLLSGHVPFAAANALVTVGSTLIATELHSRFTFGQDKPGKSDHVKAALTVLVCYLFTTAAMLTLRAIDPNAGVLVEQAVYLSASGLAGIGRFAFMRLVIFAKKSPKSTPCVLAREAVVTAA